MKIEINSDIDKYKETVALGLNAKQMVFSLLTLIVGIGVVTLLYQFVGLTAAVYIAVPICAPLGMAGFYNYRGMSFWEVNKRRFQYAFRNHALTFHSVNEGESVIREYENKRMMEEKLKRRELKKNKNSGSVSNEETEKQIKRTIRKMIVFLVVFVIVIVGSIIAYQMGWLDDVIYEVKALLNEYLG